MHILPLYHTWVANFSAKPILSPNYWYFLTNTILFFPKHLLYYLYTFQKRIPSLHFVPSKEKKLPLLTSSQHKYQILPLELQSRRQKCLRQQLIELKCLNQLRIWQKLGRNHPISPTCARSRDFKPFELLTEHQICAF